MGETILQFGSGRFLRGFVDLFVMEQNRKGLDCGGVVVAQSVGNERSQVLARQGGKFHVLVRGKQGGAIIDTVSEVDCIRRALPITEAWQELLEVAASPSLTLIVSNTTEAGLARSEADGVEQSPPRSFPARLLQLLRRRWEVGLSGVVILPLELLENNAERLLKLVLEQATQWNYPLEFTEWLSNSCGWHNTLVDRIVTEKPEGHPLLATDALLTVAEPFAFWAIEDAERSLEQVSPLFTHPAVHLVPSALPYQLRKVRILNGAHTALVCRVRDLGIPTVREALAIPETSDWLRRLLSEEIVPTLAGRVAEPELFMEQTLERFANPFLNHKIEDIAVNHSIKMDIRLAPTRDEYANKFGRRPPLLDSLFAQNSFT